MVPLYWVTCMGLPELRLDYVFSQSNTDSPLDESKAVIMKELREILETFPDRKVLVYPTPRAARRRRRRPRPRTPREGAHLRLRQHPGPSGAPSSAAASCTGVVKGALILLFEILLGGAGRAAVKDLSYEDRRAYYARKPEPW